MDIGKPNSTTGNNNGNLRTDATPCGSKNNSLKYTGIYNMPPLEPTNITTNDKNKKGNNRNNKPNNHKRYIHKKYKRMPHNSEKNVDDIHNNVNNNNTRPTDVTNDYLLNAIFIQSNMINNLREDTARLYNKINDMEIVVHTKLYNQKLENDNTRMEICNILKDMKFDLIDIKKYTKIYEAGDNKLQTPFEKHNKHIDQVYPSDPLDLSFIKHPNIAFDGNPRIAKNKSTPEKKRTTIKKNKNATNGTTNTYKSKPKKDNTDKCDKYNDTTTIKVFPHSGSMIFGNIFEHLDPSNDDDVVKNNAFDDIKMPDMKKNIHKSVELDTHSDFVELELKNLDNIADQGRKFIEMSWNYYNSKEKSVPTIATDDSHDMNNIDIGDGSDNSDNIDKEISTKNYEIQQREGRPMSLEQHLPADLIRLLMPSFDNKKTSKKNSASVKKKTKGTIESDSELIEYIEKEITKHTNGTYEFLGKKYSLNPIKIMKLVKPLDILNCMIGMKNVKNNIYNFVSYFLQTNKNDGMMNTAIYGKPGIGKTNLGKILCMIYSALEIVPSSEFKLVKASELIGKFVGETRQKTKQVLAEADGGVLFIDEAYSLTSGSGERYSYGKECIDTLNQELSENKKKLVVIIAGYEKEINECFFALNQGLERRFPFRYNLIEYTKNEMKDIFIRMIRLGEDIYLDINVKDDDILNLFDNMENFSNCGGDIENLITHIKFANSKKSLGKHPNMRNIITKADLKNGLKTYKLHKTKKDMSWQKLYV